MTSKIRTQTILALLAVSMAACSDPPSGLEHSVPDIAFLRESNAFSVDLMLVGHDGGGLRRLADAGNWLAWSPDGKKLALGSYDGLGIDVMDADGSNRRTIIRGHVAWPVWSPGGDRIFFSQNVGPYLDTANIYSALPDGTDMQQATATDTRFLLVRLGGFEPRSTGRMVLWKLRDVAGNSVGAIYVAAHDGNDLVQITSDADSASNPSWSPDGSRILFTKPVKTPTARGAIFTMLPDGTGVTQLSTGGPWNDDRPAWAPDGSRIVFESDRDGQGQIYSRQIYTMNSDGTNQKRLVESSAFDYSPAWRPGQK